MDVDPFFHWRSAGPHSMGADQLKALGDHAGRTEIFAEPLDALGGKAGLFLQHLDSRLFDSLVVLVTDQAGRQFQGNAPAERHPRLLDEDGFAVMLGEDDHGADAAAALDIFPAAAGHDADILALPVAFGRLPKPIVLSLCNGHNSMSLSGISFLSSAERGKCSAST